MTALQLRFQRSIKLGNRLPGQPGTSKSLLGYLDDEPLKTVVALNASVLLYSYVAVVISALWVEPTDFGWPLKAVYLSATLSDSILLGNDLYLAGWKNRNLGLLWQQKERVALFALFLFSALTSLRIVISSNVGIGDLRYLDTVTRIEMSLAILSAALFMIKPAVDSLRKLVSWVDRFVK